MRLAWFRATRPDPRALLDPGTALVTALGQLHRIDIVTEAEAHDFVWKHDRQPYDLCVYEIARTPAREFPWPYLLHYPGVVILRHTTLADPRGWGGSRAIVVGDASVSQSLAAERPEARLRVVPWGSNPEIDITSPPVRQNGLPSKSERGALRDRPRAPIQVAALGGDRRDVVERAVARAAQRGAPVVLLPETSAGELLRQADIAVDLEWPPAAGPPFAALHAMASNIAVIVLEIEATAAWPALDPQTWLPRGFTSEPPIVVSVDPRDEEHSLMLAITRLSADAILRASLAAAGRDWWRAHASIDHTAALFAEVLREAVALEPACAAPVADGSGIARGILDEIGVSVDFL